MTKEEISKLPPYLLNRVYLEDRTLGSIYNAQGGIVAKSLELPWKDNQRSISCIPEGVYHVTKEKPIPLDDPSTLEDESMGRHPRNYWHFRIHNVPNRSGVLIHRGTDVDDSRGCILVASRFANVETDKPVLEESGKKLQFMVDTFPNDFQLIVDKK